MGVVLGGCVLQYYDIRKECVGDLCYDFSNLEAFLNQEDVRDAIGVGDRKFVSCSPLVYEAMIVDWMRNLEAGIPALLEDGVKMLVYAGEYDLICNWLGKVFRLVLLHPTSSPHRPPKNRFVFFACIEHK